MFSYLWETEGNNSASFCKVVLLVSLVVQYYTYKKHVDVSYHYSTLLLYGRSTSIYHASGSLNSSCFVLKLL